MDAAPHRGRTPAAIAAWAGLCALLSLGALAFHLLAGAHDERVFTFFYADAVVGLAFPLAGALVARKEPGNVTALVLAAGGLVGVSAFSHEFAYHVAVEGSGSPLVAPLAWLGTWTWSGYWLQPTLLPLLFPDGRLGSRRWRPVLWVVLTLLTVSALAAAFKPGAVDSIESARVGNPLGVGTAEAPFIAVQGLTSFLTAIPGTAVCLTALLVRRRRAGGQARAQLDWLVLGFATCLVLVIGAAALGESLPVVRDLLYVGAFTAIPAAIAVAVWRHQLFGVDAVLRRAVAYTLLTAIAGSVYVVVAAGAGVAGIRGRVGAAGAALAVVVASAARARVRAFVDRRLFGRRRDPLAVIALVNEAGDTGDARTAIDRVVNTVAEALALPAVSVVADGEVLVARGRPPGGTVEVPITVEGRQLATLTVGTRPRSAGVDPAERAVLVAAAQRIGAILHTAAIAADLQHIREQLVSAREEERRRLRRELHDGVGPSLAGMALQVETLAHRLGPETGLTERALALREQLQQTAREVRRIVHGLRPAAVDDLGLVEALRQLSRLDGVEGRVVVDVPDTLPEMPAAVESSAYRIAAEAVTNSLRHGRAAECVVQVTSSPSWLTVEVCDDGAGFGPETASGVGLQSMHERTAEIGGELAIRSAPGHGTTVVARLPWRTA
ncbi:MAG TPA: sensor histidine kinase [Acidimicrobiales bacterium]|nr:sensor histidine kinase [Acidimicrobiales bacterium]